MGAIVVDDGMFAPAAVRFIGKIVEVADGRFSVASGLMWYWSIPARRLKFRCDVISAAIAGIFVIAALVE